jgi:hypothetical protein
MTEDAEPTDSEFRQLFSREDLKIKRAVGAVALVDALGFRGIWKRFTSERVLQFLARARERATKDAMMRLIFNRQRISVIAFSDTLLVVAFPRDDAADGEGIAEAIEALAATVSFLQITGSGGEADDPKLAYRGCVAVGEVSVGGGLFVGEAVDEAADWYEEADAGLVWLTPSAARAASPTRNERVPSLVPFDIPLKTGKLSSLVVNPFLVQAAQSYGTLASLDRLEQRLLKPFDSSSAVDVAIKKQNTARFLAAAKEVTAAVLPTHLKNVVTALGAALGEDNEQ